MAEGGRVDGEGEEGSWEAWTVVEEDEGFVGSGLDKAAEAADWPYDSS